MADTQRSKATLIGTTYVDGQAAGSISAQDHRDLIESLTPNWGRCDMQGNATATTIAVAGTYVKIAGTSSLSGNEVGFDDDAGTSNRLKYLGVSPRHMHIAVSISFITASNGQVCAFKLWHYDSSAASGSLLDSSLVTRKTGTGSDVGSTAMHADVTMDTNDYIELHGTNETSATTITVEDMYVFSMSMFG